MKEKVFNEAIDILKAQGYKGLIMDELARKVGVSKKTLYQGFGTKHRLVLQTLENEFEIMYRDLGLICQIPELGSQEKLKASLWLITRRAFECSQQLVSDLRINPAITGPFWGHVAELNSRLLNSYLQTHTKLNEIMLTNFFGILINVAAGNQQSVNRVRLMLETIQFYTYAWAHMKNGLIKEK